MNAAVFPDPVCDEIRRVLRMDHALTQRDFRKALKLCQRCSIGLAGRDNLEKLHITRRIKEMRSEPMPPEVFAAALSEVGHR